MTPNNVTQLKPPARERPHDVVHQLLNYHADRLIREGWKFQRGQCAEVALALVQAELTLKQNQLMAEMLERME